MTEKDSTFLLKNSAKRSCIYPSSCHPALDLGDLVRIYFLCVSCLLSVGVLPVHFLKIREK